MKGIVSTLITAFGIMLGGITIMAISVGLLGTTPEALTESDVGERKTDRVSQPFSSVSVDVWDTDVEIVPSQDGGVSVSHYDTEKVSYSILVTDGVLEIRRVDLRKWYERIQFFSFKTPTLTVALPKGEYQNLTAKVRSNALTVCEGIVFDRARATVTSGTIRYCADVKQTLIANVSSGRLSVTGITANEISGTVTSGRLEVENVTCGQMNLKATSGACDVENITCDRLTLVTTSGGCDVENVTCDYLTLEGTSGSVEAEHIVASEAFSLKHTSGTVALTDVISRGDLLVKSTSGSIKLDRCDGGYISLQTTSGSVRGTVCSEKVFNATSTSGSVRVPSSVPNADLCEIKTSSGSIKISIAEQE